MKLNKKEIDSRIEKEFGGNWLRLESELILAGADDNYLDYIREVTICGSRINTYA